MIFVGTWRSPGHALTRGRIDLTGAIAAHRRMWERADATDTAPIGRRACAGGGPVRPAAD